MFSQLCTYPKKIQDKKVNVTKEHRGPASKSFTIFIENKVFFIYNVFWSPFLLSSPRTYPPPYLSNSIPSLSPSLEKLPKKNFKKPMPIKMKRHQKHIHTNKTYRNTKSEIIKYKQKRREVKRAHTKQYATKNDPKNAIEFVLQH